MKEWKNPTIETLDVDATMGGGWNTSDADREWWTGVGDPSNTEYNTPGEVPDEFTPHYNATFNS